MIDTLLFFLTLTGGAFWTITVLVVFMAVLDALANRNFSRGHDE